MFVTFDEDLITRISEGTRGSPGCAPWPSRRLSAMGQARHCSSNRTRPIRSQGSPGTGLEPVRKVQL
jgi:hypothetical protein